MGGRLGCSNTSLSKCGHRSEVRGLTKWAQRGREWAENNSQAKEQSVQDVTRVNEREVVSIVLAGNDSILMIHACKVLQSTTRWHLHLRNERGLHIKIVQ